MKLIEDKYISSAEERDFLLQALYEFVLNVDLSFSATENINIILSECNKILTTERIGLNTWPEDLGEQVNRLRTAFHLKKMILRLKKQIETLEPLLDNIINNKQFRSQVRDELENELFEERNYSMGIFEALVQAFG